jgi:hypothetical protein
LAKRQALFHKTYLFHKYYKIQDLLILTVLQLFLNVFYIDLKVIVMKKICHFGILVFVMFVMSGCFIKQNIKPIASVETKEVCITENPRVKGDFLSAYRQALADKGYQTIVKTERDTTAECGLVSTYTANWNWDFAVYLVYANIKVTKDGALQGEATYNARRAGGRFDKFIKAENKIRELVNQLYP